MLPIKERENLRRFTTLRVGGVARYFATPKSREEVIHCLKFSRDRDIPLFVLGGGSNTVLGDVEGLVINTSLLRGTEVRADEESVWVKALSGTPMKELITLGVKMNLEGIYKLLGFPASVGGAVAMNAGAFGVEISDFLEEVEFISWEGELRRAKAWELNFGYRNSPFPQEGFVYAAIFRFSPSKVPVAEDYKRIRRKRKKSQPINMPTSGSTFKNPEGDFAGRLLEKVGLKGFRRGNLGFSELHANFMVNYGTARIEDVKLLIKEAKERVYQETGINLEEEVKLVESSSSDGWKVL